MILSRKNINEAVKNFLLKLNFFFLFYFFRKKISQTTPTRAAINAFSKISINVLSKHHLISKHHLCTILSLSTVRVRRKNFSFSKIFIYESHKYHLIYKHHLSTIFWRSQVFDQGPPRPARRDVLSRHRLNVVYALSY